MCSFLYIPGYLTGEEDGYQHFLATCGQLQEQLAYTGEHYSLRWETQYLLTLGTRFERWLTESVVQTGALQAAAAGGGTLVASTIAAFTWPVTLLGSAALIDNAWSMGVSRAQKAGEALAEVLASRVHGSRPITLVGCSLGARVIFFALEALAAMKQDQEDINGIRGG
eukprot:TRINITY_DN11915_c0_g1_i3.p1 TRINITY_DN11915_c0_g1~~TRINITY_DN11915_c0_g1_i3.p1  ORF type:complete len:168 (-),score=39.57 TRINITY_DN11915_c0_g1_i3:320-823(-)